MKALTMFMTALVNPLAPASYGVGYEALGFRPEPGRSSGFVVFAIRF